MDKILKETTLEDYFRKLYRNEELDGIFDEFVFKSIQIMLKNEEDYPSPETDNDKNNQNDQNDQNDKNNESSENNGNQFNWNTTFGNGHVDLSFYVDDVHHISYYNPYVSQNSQNNQECIIS